MPVDPVFLFDYTIFMQEYEIQDLNKPQKNIKYLVAAAVLVLILVVLVFYLTKVNRPASSESREVNFTVMKGDRSHVIANNLENEKIISSSGIFLIYSTLHAASSKFQAGEYVLNSDMAIPEIVDVLTHGKVVPTDRSVTLVEGLTNKQIAHYLSEREIIANDSDLEIVLKKTPVVKFIDLAKEFDYQGFLFPDTYKIAKDAGVDVLVGKMLANFENKVTDQMVLDSHNFKQALIVASIVEKEVGRNQDKITDEDLQTLQKERELVASVFYNRLKIGMPLESDATVNYITGKSDRSVTIEDTKIKSPYNTYKYRGLPPGPIGNPGLNAIKAAIYPASSDYLYFLNAPDGTAYFARTLAEHNANKAKYLK